MCRAAYSASNSHNNETLTYKSKRLLPNSWSQFAETASVLINHIQWTQSEARVQWTLPPVCSLKITMTVGHVWLFQRESLQNWWWGWMHDTVAKKITEPEWNWSLRAGMCQILRIKQWQIITWKQEQLVPNIARNNWYGPLSEQVGKANIQV